MTSPVRIKRAYEMSEPSDGVRVLVDRLWPRGLSKAQAKIDLWLKDVAPTPELRRWFGHRPERWDEFRVRYRTELDGNSAVADLRALKGKITLIYGAKDEAHNNAVVLAQYLRGHGRR